MLPPRELNGYPVIKYAPRKNMADLGAYVVMIKRPVGTRYCVATWSPLEGDGWWSGNYTNVRQEAEEYFSDREA